MTINFKNELFSETKFTNNSDGIKLVKNCTFINVDLRGYEVKESTFEGCVFINCDLLDMKDALKDCKKIMCRLWSIELEEYVNDIA